MKLANLALTVFYINVVSAEIFTLEQESEIQTYVENVMDCRKIPGLVLSVVKGDETWSRGYGTADLESGRLVDNSTLFVIGSLGKAFTMTLLGHFLQQNGLNWDSKLSDIPNANYEFTDENRTREVTIADLLSHRTGLSSVTDYGFIAGYPAGTTKGTMVRRLKYVPASGKLREGFRYNNLMYMVLGHVTETIAVERWEDLIKSRLLEPIGMEDSTVLTESKDVLKDSTARPYILQDDQLQPGTDGIYKISPLEPAGSIMSTGLDMLKWMKFNIENATTSDGIILLDQDLFEQAFQEQITLSPFASAVYSIKTPEYPVDDVTSGYGYGWFTATYRGHRKVWHSGGLFSYVSLIWIFRDDNVGIFASVNGPGLPKNGGRALNTIFLFLSDVLLGYEPWLNQYTACSFPSPWQNSTTFDIPPHEKMKNDNLTDFIGTYGSHLLPDVTISMHNPAAANSSLLFDMNRIKGYLFPTDKGERLGFQMSQPWEYAIERVVNDNFTIRYPVDFVRSDDNNVIGFDIALDGLVNITFRKDLRFDPQDTVGKGVSLRFSLSLFLSVLYIAIAIQ